MGSFSELTLAFTFASETPVKVLGAFATWRTGEDAPSLPTLEEALGANAVDDAETYLSGYAGDDPVGPLPLLRRAAVWRWLLDWGENAYFPGTPGCALRWDRYGKRWTLTVRTAPKMGGDFVQSIIGPLGELARDGTRERPRFVGYIADEYDDRPVLIWSSGRAPFSFEAGDKDASRPPGRRAAIGARALVSPPRSADLQVGTPGRVRPERHSAGRGSTRSDALPCSTDMRIA